MNNTKQIFYLLFIKTLDLVYGSQKVHKIKSTSGNDQVEMHPSSKILKSAQSRNKNVEEEKSGEFKNLPTQYAEYAYFYFL